MNLIKGTLLGVEKSHSQQTLEFYCVANCSQFTQGLIYLPSFNSQWCQILYEMLLVHVLAQIAWDINQTKLVTIFPSDPHSHSYRLCCSNAQTSLSVVGPGAWLVHGDRSMFLNHLSNVSLLNNNEQKQNLLHYTKSLLTRLVYLEATLSMNPRLQNQRIISLWNGELQHQFVLQLVFCCTWNSSMCTLCFQCSGERNGALSVILKYICFPLYETPIV